MIFYTCPKRKNKVMYKSRLEAESMYACYNCRKCSGIQKYELRRAKK